MIQAVDCFSRLIGSELQQNVIWINMILKTSIV